MRFADIPGLPETKKYLVHAVDNNHLAHALLFSGTQGGAGLPIALAFATYLNCTNRQEHDSCGTCPSCVKNDKFIHPDLHFAFPVSSTKKISGKDVVSTSFLTEWRSFLAERPYGTPTDWSRHFGGEDKQLNISKEESRHIIRNLSLKAFEGEYKVMLIWLPEFMHTSSANGILKILEEPPQKTIFILVSEDSEKLLTTILSRTQQFRIPPFSDEDLARILEERHGADESRARQLAHMADGSLARAVELMNEVEDDSHELFRVWMRHCYTVDLTELVAWSDRFQQMKKMGQKNLLQYGLAMMRETLLQCARAENLSRLHGEEQQFVLNFVKVMDADKVAAVTEQLNTAFYHLERNANAKILFLNLSLTVARILRTK